MSSLSTIDAHMPGRRLRSRYAVPCLAHDTPWLMAPALIVVAGTFVLPLAVIAWYSLMSRPMAACCPG